jgi:hypothetical protein
MTIIKSMRFKFRKTFYYQKKPALHVYWRFLAGFLRDNWRLLKKQGISGNFG